MTAYYQISQEGITFLEKYALVDYSSGVVVILLNGWLLLFICFILAAIVYVPFFVQKSNKLHIEENKNLGRLWGENE